MHTTLKVLTHEKIKRIKTQVSGADKSEATHALRLGAPYTGTTYRARRRQSPGRTRAVWPDPFPSRGCEVSPQRPGGSYLGNRTPTANMVTPLSFSCLAGSARCPWDCPSVTTTRIWGTEAFRPPGKPWRRRYFRARPVSVRPPLSSHRGRKQRRVSHPWTGGPTTPCNKGLLGCW